VETMHNYLLFGHLLQVKRVDPDQVHSRLWVGHYVSKNKGLHMKVGKESIMEKKAIAQVNKVKGSL
jgi:hypothetical protein